MRHLTKKNTLGRAKDQRDALLKALATELLTHGEIKTTLAKAKALRPYVDNLVTLAKKGDLTSRRQAAKFIYDKELDKFIDTATGELFETLEEGKKLPKQTVLRRLFSVIGKKYVDRNGGYTQIVKIGPRRGDAAEMAIIKLV